MELVGGNGDSWRGGCGFVVMGGMVVMMALVVVFVLVIKIAIGAVVVNLKKNGKLYISE